MAFNLDLDFWGRARSELFSLTHRDGSKLAVPSSSSTSDPRPLFEAVNQSMLLRGRKRYVFVFVVTRWRVRARVRSSGFPQPRLDNVGRGDPAENMKEENAVISRRDVSLLFTHTLYTLFPSSLSSSRYLLCVRASSGTLSRPSSIPRNTEYRRSDSLSPICRKHSTRSPACRLAVCHLILRDRCTTSSAGCMLATIIKGRRGIIDCPSS